MELKNIEEIGITTRSVGYGTAVGRWIINPEYRSFGHIYNEMIDFIYKNSGLNEYELPDIVKVVLNAVAIQLSKTKQV